MTDAKSKQIDQASQELVNSYTANVRKFQDALNKKIVDELKTGLHAINEGKFLGEVVNDFNESLTIAVLTLRKVAGSSIKENSNYVLMNVLQTTNGYQTESLKLVELSDELVSRLTQVVNSYIKLVDAGKITPSLVQDVAADYQQRKTQWELRKQRMEADIAAAKAAKAVEVIDGAEVVEEASPMPSQDDQVRATSGVAVIEAEVVEVKEA